MRSYVVAKRSGISDLVDRNVERFGNWVGGTVTLRRNNLVFSTNAMNSQLQENADDLVATYSQISSCALGRMMMLFKTADLQTSFGELHLKAACVY